MDLAKVVCVHINEIYFALENYSIANANAQCGRAEPKLYSIVLRQTIANRNIPYNNYSCVVLCYTVCVFSASQNYEIINNNNKKVFNITTYLLEMHRLPSDCFSSYVSSALHIVQIKLLPSTWPHASKMSADSHSPVQTKSFASCISFVSFFSGVFSLFLLHIKLFHTK